MLACDPSVAEQMCRNEGKYPSRIAGENRMKWFFNRIRNEDATMPFEYVGERLI